MRVRGLGVAVAAALGALAARGRIPAPRTVRTGAARLREELIQDLDEASAAGRRARAEALARFDRELAEARSRRRPAPDGARIHSEGR